MTGPPDGLLAVGPVVVLSGDAARVAAAALLIAIRYRRVNGLPPSARYEHLARALVTAAGQSDDREPEFSDAGHMQHPHFTSPAMTIEDAAERLGLSRRQTRRLAPRLGGRIVSGRWLVDEVAVAEHLDGKHG